MASIRVAIFGVGNCAKSLVEGVEYYRNHPNSTGLIHRDIGGYKPSDIRFVLAYDVSSQKVGRPLSGAISRQPNCARSLSNYKPEETDATIVQMGAVLDGVADHMEQEFTPSDWKQPNEMEVGKRLLEEKVDIAVIYLPVGSQAAATFYVSACLAAKVPFVNCIPVFIASNPEMGKLVRWADICCIGDDIRSQVGASILSQVLQEMFIDRGAKVKCHIQTNHGGNSDFKNMLDRSRLESKKKSKEGVISSQYVTRNLQSNGAYIQAGPSEYIPYLEDTKVAHIRVEAEGFAGAPIELDAKLTVQDSPNSAGVVIDAIRFLKVAQELGIRGPLEGPSAYLFKSPPVQLTYAQAYEECRRLASRQLPSGYGYQAKAAEDSPAKPSGHPATAG